MVGDGHNFRRVVGGGGWGVGVGWDQNHRTDFENPVIRPVFHM